MKSYWRTNKISNNKTKWKNLSKLQIAKEYNPSSIIGGNYSPYINKYIDDSLSSRNKYQSSIYYYGPRKSNIIEFAHLKNNPKSPLIVFIHGGYWQELSIKHSYFPAKGAIENKFAYASIDYTLAPNLQLSEIVNECSEAIKWIVDNSHYLGIDKEKIIISGSSAGAHLASMVILNKQIYSANICGSILVSGIYEIEPLINTSINDALNLNIDEANNNSPILKSLKIFPPSLIVYGEIETLEFKRQSNSFINKLLDFKCKTKFFEISNKNHFDVILDLTDNKKKLGKEVFKFLNLLEPINAKI